MKRTASARKSSNERDTSTRSRRSTGAERRFAVCIRNDGYEASLERNKIYEVLSDRDAERDGDVRVVTRAVKTTCLPRTGSSPSRYQHHCVEVLAQLNPSLLGTE